MWRQVLILLVLISCFDLPAAVGAALDIVRDGKPLATIVVEGANQSRAQPSRKGKKPTKRKQTDAESGDAKAAGVLQDWVKKMTGAELPIGDAAIDGQVGIFIGKAAIAAGLKIDDIDSPSHEGVHIVCDGKRILLAGQNADSTVKAACRLLEEMGCRYLMDSPLGEVYPHTATLNVKEMDRREKPGFLLRQIWGSNWTSHDLWKIWNGGGGTPITQGHAWGRYIDKDLFDKHPEYFALRKGQRQKGDWYCTSNPDLRKIFAEGVIRSLADSGGFASISPPDGTGYCECDKCRAQDDPASIEPSSGRVSVTDRYADFFNDVAKQVRGERPDAKLSFYCYADYTQAPTRGVKLEDNLIAWIAPLRYCRIHSIGNPICPSRVQLGEMIDGWSKATGNIAYRTYNYNLAECLVPFPMLSIWKHDIPYLKQHGAIGINLETLASWQIYGPHIYLSVRLAYDPSADADAVMDDYFQQFYGPSAGPIMKRYWTDIDTAYSSLHAHAGGFFAVHKVYTPEFLKHCQKLLEDATSAAKGDAAYTARVAMHAEGFRNAAQFVELRDDLNLGHVPEAQAVYHRLLERTEAQHEQHYGNKYTSDYLKRFIGKPLDAAASAVAAPKRVATVLPDRWQFAYDEPDQGRTKGYEKPDFDDSSWKQVATFSDTLDGQGLPDNKTILWYRTTFEAPDLKGKPSLHLVEVDGTATVFINGQESGSGAKKRVPFDIDGSALHPGKNSIAIRVDHSAISELFLGGIIRPVYVVTSPAP